MLTPVQFPCAAQEVRAENPTFYRTIQIYDVSIFHREAGWQAWMRKAQPRLLVLWGKYDKSFELTEPEAYRRDVPRAEVHVVEAGHFALDTAADEIAQLVRRFMK